MSVRIGLAVSSDAVRMVAVRDEHILWAGESPIEEGVLLEHAVAKLLGEMKVPRWPRPRVLAAIGPAQAQLKRLTGLPPVTDARVAARLVRESPGRFFLKNGIPLATTGVRLADKGEVWGGALDEPVVRAIADVCRREHFSLRGVVPTVLVLGRAFEDARIVWRDGDTAAEVTLHGGELSQIRRLPMGSEHDAAPPVPRTALGTLGDDAWRFADAYAAAMTRDDEPVATRLLAVGGYESPRAPRWRIGIAAGALVIAMLAAGLAPGVSALRAARLAESALRELGPARLAATRSESDLRRVSAALDEVAGFETQLRSPTAFLADLAGALPPTAQLVAVRLDSAGGNLIALAPRAGDALSRIERMDTVDEPEIVGPVTREHVGQVEKERVTIRFRWRRAAREGAR